MRVLILSFVLPLGLSSVDDARAQSAVVDGLPAGTIIFDATDVPAPTVDIALEPIFQPQPFVTPQADVATEPVIVLDPVQPLIGQSQTQASTRSPAILPLTVEGTGGGSVILDPATMAPQVDLGPGETVVQMIAVPSIIRVPVAEPVYTIRQPANLPVQRTPPEPKIDPVSGRLRDTPGWTGSAAGPASIGCFPEGSCAVLNSQ